MVDPDMLATAKQALTDRPDKDTDGWMDQCAKYLMDNVGLFLWQAVAVMAELHTNGWCKYDGTRDRIVG